MSRLLGCKLSEECVSFESCGRRQGELELELKEKVPQGMKVDLLRSMAVQRAEITGIQLQAMPADNSAARRGSIEEGPSPERDQCTQCKYRPRDRTKFCRYS